MRLKKNANRTSVNSHVFHKHAKATALRRYSWMITKKAAYHRAAFSEWKVNKMIPNWLIQRAYLTPDKIALSFEDENMDICATKRASDDLARKLKANGLKEGDRIALLGPSNAEMVFIIHACMLLGLEIVMLNSRLTKKELEWQLDDSDAIAVIVSDELRSLVV